MGMEMYRGHVYLLQLVDQCWYVGYTRRKDPKKRIEEHREGGDRAAEWTKLHPPKKGGRVFFFRAKDKRLETRITVEAMKLYGKDKVRGGPWCSCDLKYLEIGRKLPPFDTYIVKYLIQ